MLFTNPQKLAQYIQLMYIDLWITLDGNLIFFFLFLNIFLTFFFKFFRCINNTEIIGVDMDHCVGLFTDLTINPDTLQPYGEKCNYFLHFFWYRCPDHVILIGRQMTNIVSNFEYLVLLFEIWGNFKYLEGCLNSKEIILSELGSFQIWF